MERGDRADRLVYRAAMAGEPSVHSQQTHFVGKSFLIRYDVVSQVDVLKMPPRLTIG